MVLRIFYHIPQEFYYRRGVMTDASHYHGGDMGDEIAALTSLILGIRLRAGEIDRHFQPDQDPYGMPVALGQKPTPQLLTASRPQIPRLAGWRNLTDVIQLEDFVRLEVADSNALVKAARLYQQAVWVADADPALAWLLLVSSIESAANHRAISSDGQAAREVGPMTEIKPLLDGRGCSDLIEPIAQLLKQYTGAARKFEEFLLAFTPGPPESQRPAFGRLSFENADLKRAFRKIYDHRSKALHGGTAFPQPMCEAPQQFDRAGTQLCEAPLGLAIHTLNASWKSEDVPMLLHIFEHIVRNALLRWWKDMVGASQPHAG
jgi:hypothetical protein